MFEHLVYDPIHVQQYRHEYEAYRVKVIVRSLLQEADSSIWSEKCILLCVKALQWMHVNSPLFMGPVLEREFEQMRQQVHKIIAPLNISLVCLEQMLWRRVPRNYVNWAIPGPVKNIEELWIILQQLVDFATEERKRDFAAGHALFAMLCIDWMLQNPDLLCINSGSSSRLHNILSGAISENHVLTEMYARQLAKLNLSI